VMASYKGRALGSIGNYGCYSFHETKNYSMGKGGAILINDPADIDRAEIIREKGTNRKKFWQGKVDKYTWVSKGSSYLPSDINAAYLYPQLLMRDEINQDRMAAWNTYYSDLEPLEEAGKINLPVIPEGCEHNAHMFYIKTKDFQERSMLMNFLKDRDISSVFHYVPLHSSDAGLEYGEFRGEDRYTTAESDRLLRLPMYYGLDEESVHRVTDAVREFYGI